MLEPQEKTAARMFLNVAEHNLAQTLIEDPPQFVVPSWIALYRHSCQARNGLSTALELKEMYVSSPTIIVESTLDGRHTAYFHDIWRASSDLDTWQMPQGRFGFIYRQGRCRYCRAAARSETGRLVDGWERGPSPGAVTC